MRILFVFDPEREAILLVAGDKAGRWRQWYSDVIPVAEARYDEYVAAARHREGRGCSMSGYRRWSEVKRRVREASPVSDAQWDERKQAAWTATEAHVLGYHLRAIREEQGLTQAQVAASLGISQARVSQVERGEIHNLETMRSYAAALGARITVSIEYGDRRLGAA